MLAVAIMTAEAGDGVFWYRQGANKVEFERTKAECQSRQLEAAIAPPLAWLPIFDLCVRANGWVQIPNARPAALLSERRAQRTEQRRAAAMTGGAMARLTAPPDQGSNGFDHRQAW
jgi:hypothetical protein